METHNPYAPPLANLADSELRAHIDETALALQAFIGPKSEYYIRKWESMDSLPWSWNWPSFLFGAFWMAYRRMYVNTFVLCAIGLFVGFIRSTSNDEGTTVLVILVNWSINIGLGLFGNYLYRRHAENHFAAVIARSDLTNNQQIELLSDRGGVRGAASFLTVILYFAAAFVMAVSVRS